MEDIDQSSKRRVGVLGGSFDPPTADHLRMCAEALNLTELDEVWMVPCGTRPDKPSLVTPPQVRQAMLQLAITDLLPAEFPVRVSDIEV